MTLREIEKLTQDFSEARRSLAEKVQNMEDEIRQIKKKYLAGIKRAVEVAVEKKSRLYSAIDGNPELFIKPRSIILHGIKIGYMKGKGEITWDDTGQVVRLIKKHFPEQSETLIKIMETPVKSALAQLSVQDLKRIGVTVIETGDQVLIKATDTEVDKLVEALLREEIEKEAA